MTKHISKHIASTCLLLAITTSPMIASATNAETTIADKTPQLVGGYPYNISSMHVNWASNDDVVVKVYTDFAGKAGTNTGGAIDGWWIRYGDLFIGTNPSFDSAGNDTGTNWDYAFTLDTSDSGPNRKSNPASDKSGYLFSTDTGSKSTANDWHGNLSIPSSGTNAGYDRNPELVTNNYTGQTNLDSGAKWHVNTVDDYVSFSFNIGGLGLTDPSQLAFRWAMTCANDIISGVAYAPGGGNQVPAPAAITLILTGLVGLGFMRRRRTDSIEA